METKVRVIPNARPSIGKEELLEVQKVFETGWLGMGSVVFEFEKAISGYLGAKHVICVNTGTSAIHIALDALGLKEADEVIVPSLTFVSSIQAICACGATPVFCEIDPDTLCIDLKDVKKKLTKRTKAIMPVHYGGEPCDMEGLISLARQFSLNLVEDAAHAFGSRYKGKMVGSLGDLTCFSFDPIKNITCGEGGAVVTGDDKLAQIIIKKRILGIDKDTWHRYKNQRSWSYEVVTKGYRYHLSNINAAIGMVQLRKIEDFLRKKRDVCGQYNAAFNGLKGITLLKRDYGNIAPFNYVIRVKKDRDALIGYLKERGIDAGIHYIPNHLQPAFKQFYTPLPVTEGVFDQIATLPLYVDMNEQDILRVIEAVLSFLKC